LEITNKLVVEREAGIGRILLNQPEKHNAISFEMWQGMASVLEDFALDDEVRVVVLRGAGGRAFSAGADISQFEDKRGSPEAVATYNGAAQRAHDALRDCPKPTIAHVEGYCVGGGLGVALCCDLRLASDDARFAIPAARLGLGYTYDNLSMLVRLVGPAAAREILFTARRFDAEEASRMGLVNQVRDRDALEGLVADYAERIAGNAPLTVRACKHIVGESQKDPADRDLDECQRLVDGCYASADYVEGRQAFMEKRSPRFQGR
jgi:enoyl-CoA hydratase/carnithine racemase